MIHQPDLVLDVITKSKVKQFINLFSLNIVVGEIMVYPLLS